MARIGVFDSGVGGLSVATAIERGMPSEEIIFSNDPENVPYGTKTEDQLYEMSLPKLQQLAEKGCDVIVIACNTLSTTIIDRLKAEIPIPLIGVEPMVKEAAGMSKSGVFAVCATPATLKSDRYRQLCHQYADQTAVVEPDCSEWAFMIENDAIDRARITMAVEDVLAQGADVIVLGCTHYHWIESLIKMAASGRATILQPEQHIIEEVKRVLSRRS